MSEKFHISPLPLLPIARASVIAVGSLAVAGSIALTFAGDAGSVTPMLAGLGVALAAALGALLPLMWANRRPDDRLVGGLMLMMLARMLLTFKAAAALVLLGLNTEAVLVWVLLAYLVLLVVEVTAIAKRLLADETEPSVLTKESAA